MNLPRSLFPLPFLAAVALAQPAGVTPLNEATVETSFSSRESIGFGGVDRGEVGVAHFSVSATFRQAWNERTFFSYGVAYRLHRLDATAGLPLPETLNEFSLNLGLRHRLSDQWSLIASLRPGFYGDFEDLDSDSLNAPLLLLANYTTSPALTWSVGVNANPFSDNPVLPFVGVNWAFAENWRFILGFPQTGFAWSAAENLTVRAGVSFAGGSFRVTENLGVPTAGVARLANTYVDFREVRAGFGLDWNLGKNATVNFDFGAVTDRKFDYFDRDFRLDGGAGVYGALSLRMAF